MKKQKAQSAKKPPQKTQRKFEQYSNSQITPSRFRGRARLVVGIPERDLPRFDREKAMAKARGVMETDPFMFGTVQTYVDNIVGSGYTLKMATGDKPYDSEVESAWNEEKDHLDIRGVRSWGKMQRSWEYRKVIDGDVGVYHNFRDPEDDDRLYVATIEADRIRCKKFDYLDQGIEWNGYGRPTRYFIGPRPKDQLDMIRLLRRGGPVDADDFYLYAHYPSERVDQLRGVSMLLPMFNTLQDVREIMDAYLQKIKNAAMLVFASKMEPSPTGAIWGSEVEEKKENEDGATRNTRKMVPGTMLDLGENESVSVLESKEPNAQVEPWIRFVFRYAGIALGMPLEFQLFDLGSLNYSSARAVLEMAKRRFRCEQDALAIPSSLVFCSWHKSKIEQGELVPVKTIKYPHAHRWGRPAWPYLNPQQEAQANGILLDRHLVSPQSILAESGGQDIEEIIRDWTHYMELTKKAGLPVMFGQSALPVNATQDGQPPDEPSGDEKETQK